MEVCVTIKNCHDCRHQGHSGAFTPGGPKLVCEHDDAPEIVARVKNIHTLTIEDYRKINSSNEQERREGDRIFKKSGTYWKNRVLPHGGKRIPGWCPLKHGRNY